MFRQLWNKVKQHPQFRALSSAGLMGVGIGLAGALLSAVGHAETLDNSSATNTSEDIYTKIRLQRMKEKQDSCRVCNPGSFDNIKMMYGGFNAFTPTKGLEKPYLPPASSTSTQPTSPDASSTKQATTTNDTQSQESQGLEEDDPAAPTHAGDPIPGMKGKIAYVDIDPDEPVRRVRVQLNDDGSIAPLECPADYFKLARSTWTYLHTMAAFYPENPSSELRENTKVFMDVVSKTYPCDTCREHMQDYLKKNPVTTGSNRELSMWICGFHNDVNRMQQKPVVSCDPEYLLRRYRDGYDDGACQ